MVEGRSKYGAVARLGMVTVLAVLLVTAAGATGTTPPPWNLQITRGKHLSKTFIRIPASQHYLTFKNGIPGLTAANLWVNGRVVFRGWVSDGQVERRDVAAYMRPGRMNMIRITGMGERGVTATLTISETPD